MNGSLGQQLYAMWDVLAGRQCDGAFGIHNRQGEPSLAARVERGGLIS
jgi:hypothetical protein